MENDFQKMVTLRCIACRGTNTVFFGDKNNFPLYRCKNCGLLFVHPVPKDTKDLYSADYFSGATRGFGYVDYDRDKEVMKDVFISYLGRIERFMPRKGSLLDVGAASGYFLETARERGWRVAGVEVSEYAAKQARAKGLAVETATLEDASSDPESYDAITMWDVFEHFTDPDASLRAASRLLKSGGVIAINTPDSSSFFARALGKRWHLLVPPEHLFYFNPKSARLFLKKHGLETLETVKIGKRFTLQYVLDIASKWLAIGWLYRLSSFVRKTPLGRLAIPIHLRDNFFLIARKK